MAIRAACASTNFLTSTTWALVDQSSTTGVGYLNSETGADTLTTAYSGTVSSVFSWSSGAPTIDGIGLKISNRTGTTGTLSVHLEVATVEVTGTAVTVNMSDIPAIVTGDVNGGWTFFKFAAPVALSNSTSYSVAAKTSTGSMCNVYRDGTTDNMSRYLRTTTTGAMATGDDFIITREWTAAGTSTARTVTMDALASSITDYGAASTSQVTPSGSICDGGTLAYGTTAATAYYLRQSGHLIVYLGGTLSIGTTGGGEIPRDSSALLNFDCGANVDFGLIVRNGGTFNAQGLSRTSGKNIFKCLLNTDEAANSTSLGVDTDTGWLDNDAIAVASTTRTSTQCESGLMNGNANASDLTVDGFGGAGGGVANAHSGTAPTQAEVILLTRNVQIFGASASLQSFILIQPTAVIDIDWTEIKWMGSNTANQRGINVNTTTGSCSIQFSSLHDFSVTNSVGIHVTSATFNNFTFSSNVTFNIDNVHLNISAGTSGTSITCDSNIFMKNVSVTNLITYNDVGGVFTNNIATGGASTGFSISETAVVGTLSGITAHSNAGGGASINCISSIVGSITSWRNGAAGLTPTNSFSVVFNTVTLFGNTTTNLDLGTGEANLTFNSLTSNGDTTFSTTNGIIVGTQRNVSPIYINSGDFSTVAGIKTAHTNDINFSLIGTYVAMYLNNTKLGAATEIASLTTNATEGSFISSQKHDQTAALHKTFKKYGILLIETGTVHTGSQSVKMTPNTASKKLESGSFLAAVASGATVTPSIYVYEDGTYNGARARLIVKRNDAIGITSDTVLDTRTGAADATWELMTGTTASATDDGVMEFIVDCDGTAGNVYIDSASVT
jgi:hypothetical protein